MKWTNWERACGTGATLSLMAIFLTGGDLLLGTFPIGNALYWTFLVYTVATIAFAHFLFFLLGRKINPPHRGRLPRYVEYAYTVIISLGLAQVFFSAPQIASYVRYVGGEESRLVEKIVKQAQAYAQNECKTNDANFTSIYCFKVTLIAMASEPRDYITKYILPDQEFLDHVVRMVGGGPAGTVIVMSPIRTYAAQLRALNEYSVRPTLGDLSGVLAWLALMLLPVGIALRFVKTSLELYGGLDGNASAQTRTGASASEQ
jgi:hypothetical protein